MVLACSVDVLMDLPFGRIKKLFVLKKYSVGLATGVSWCPFCSFSMSICGLAGMGFPLQNLPRLHLFEVVERPRQVLNHGLDSLLAGC